MRFVIYGAGAIGGVIGARLAQSGEDVLLIARGAHYQAIRDHGLRLQSPDEAVTLDIPVASDARDVRGDDIVLLAVKSQDTARAIESLAGVAPPVVCVQNGVENERVALRWLPDVYGVCVMCPTTHLEPGVVQANSAPVTGLLDIGRWPGGVDERAGAIAAALERSTFRSIVRPDIARWKYCKLLLNLGNAIEAVCGPSARGGPLTKVVHEEGVAVLRAAGIDFASEGEDMERRNGLLTVRPIDGRRREGGSSWQSLSRGTGSIESDYLNGEIVLLGRLHGVPTPVNAVLQRYAAQMARARTPPGAVTVDEVLRAAAT